MYKQLIILFLVFIQPFFIKSQTPHEIFKNGNSQYEQKNYEDYIKVLEQQIARERRARIHSEVFDKMNTDFQINALKNKVRSLEDKNFWNNQ